MASQTTDPAQTVVDLGWLIQRTGLGDRNAFAELYKKTAPTLLGLAIAILKNRDDAEETIQEGFFRVWRQASSFDPEKGDAIAWLATIVRNRALSLRKYRLRNNRVTADNSVENYIHLVDQAREDPLSSVIGREARRVLLKGLDGLDQRKRQAIILAYFEGLTHGEIAERMGVPLGTAKSYVRRGLQSMGQTFATSGRYSIEDLISGEYVLGVLHPQAARGFETRRAKDARYCVAADRWEFLFTGMLAFVLPLDPPRYIFDRITYISGSVTSD